MAKTKKVTVTVPKDVAATLEGWTKSGNIASVSAYVSESVQQRMSRDTSLQKLEAAFGRRPDPGMVDAVVRRMSGRSEASPGAA
jgi:Arc/MetJ-type ribon-helix-helix transcriptional regulator